jgi:septum site-determining protein MinC
MSANLNEQPDVPAQFELKAGSFTLPLLRLLGTDMDAVAHQLGDTVAKAGGFFHNAPVVIDLKEVAGQAEDVEFPLLVGLMRGHGMIPVGVRGGTPAQNAAAEAMELAVLSDGQARRPEAASRAAPAPRPVPAAQAAAAPRREPAPVSMLVTRPIRSGQRVYSPGDLVIMAQVSSGAEVMADGHIHVYAPLRGRALAGVRGNLEARIFCQNLQAELVSVAGHYRISENIPADLRGKPVQIRLQERSLLIEPL